MMITNNLLRFIKRNQTAKTTVRYTELRKFANISKKKGNPLAYTVITANKNGIDFSLTTLLPGFMTRGHVHKKPYTEVYVLLKGGAQLVLIGKKRRVFNMKAGKIYLVPGKSWHRVVNKGGVNTLFISIYPSSAGHIYKKGLK